MADMANLDQTIECWEQLQQTCADQLIVPITYMNSSAAIKAFVGENGGAVCTSSNCRNVLGMGVEEIGPTRRSGTKARRHRGTEGKRKSKFCSFPISIWAATRRMPWDIPSIG